MQSFNERAKEAWRDARHVVTDTREALPEAAGELSGRGARVRGLADVRAPVGHLFIKIARHGCCVLLMIPLLHLAAMQRRCPLTDDGLVRSPTLKGYADQPCPKAQCLWLFVFLSGLRGQPCSVVLNSCVYCHVYCTGRIMGKGNYGHTCPAPGSEAWQWQRPAPPSPPTPTPTHVEGDASSGEEGERSRQHGMAAKGGLYVTCCGLGFTTQGAAATALGCAPCYMYRSTCRVLVA